MLKSVCFENYFLDRFSQTKKFTYGLVIGARNGDKEFLLVPIVTPEKVGAHDDVKKAFVHSVTDIDDKWVAMHCKNLFRMMPGGVHISGLFVISNTNVFEYCNELKKILSVINPNERCALPEFSNHTNSEKIVIACDISSQKFTCKAIETLNSSDTFRPLQIKIEPIFDDWSAFKTHVTLSVDTKIPSERTKEKLLQVFHLAVEPYLHSLVTNTILLVNGELRNENDVLCVSAEKIQPKRKHKQSNKRDGVSAANQQWAPFDLTLFGPDFPRCYRANSTSSLESGASSDTASSPLDFDSREVGSFLTIHGRIPGIAFLPRTATVFEILQALRFDIIRSTLFRLELLTDELHITCGKIEVSRMLLPQRVLVRLPACPILPLSDYKFRSETPEDVVSRIVYFCLPLRTLPSHTASVGGTSSNVSRSGSTSEVDEEDEYDDESGIIFGRSVIPVQRNRPSTAPLDDLLSSEGGVHGTPTGDSGLGASPVGSVLGDTIDVNCLDTGLEKLPEGSVDEDISDAEMLEEIVNVPQVVSQSFGAVVITGLSIFILLMSLLIAYFFFGSSDDLS